MNNHMSGKCDTFQPATGGEPVNKEVIKVRGTFIMENGTEQTLQHVEMESICSTTTKKGKKSEGNKMYNNI